MRPKATGQRKNSNDKDKAAQRLVAPGPQTKEEMRRTLEEAVRNTVAMTPPKEKEP